MDVLAACHVHSNWSYDGSWTLADLSTRFSSRGYRVLMMTEHDRGFSQTRFQQFQDACASVTNKNILVVPGIEYSDAENRVHVLVWGLLEFLGEGLPTGAILKKVQSAGGLAVLAHPSRRDAWKSFEPSWAESLLGIEIWNRKYDGWAPSKSAPDLLNTTKAVPFVGLDFHTVRQSFPLGMMLSLQSDVSEESVLRALHLRRCHACSFGRPMAGSGTDTATRILKVAEKGRRVLASIKKKSQKVLQKQFPAKNL